VFCCGMSDLEGVLVGICNPLLDISAEVEPNLLEKYDLKPSNAILAEEKHLPLYEELTKNFPVQYIAGGAGQNTIRAAQWMLQTPNATGYIGCVGKDENGRRLREAAEKDGVQVYYLEDSSTPTGTCAVLISHKDRSLVANLAAANCYKKTHYDSPELQSVIGKAKFIYATGFFLTVSPETIVAMGQHAAEYNKTFIMNVSAPFIVDFFFDRFNSALPYVDILFGNEHEFGALGKKLNWGEDLKEIALKTANLPKTTKRPRIVVVTQGCNPVIVVENGQISEYPVPVVPKEEIVDANGAGDSFVGGFLAKLVQNKSIEECIAAGNYCAGVTIRGSGTVFKGKTPSFHFSK